MIITVQKLGTGTENDAIRPNTTAENWVMVSETTTTMTIDIKD